MKIESVAENRIIVPAEVLSKTRYFLIDTGASVGLISHRIKGIVRGRRYEGTLTGAGGDIDALYICNTFAILGDKRIAQFLICDIDNIIENIKNDEGVEIAGIISLPQMRMYGAEIDTDDNYITI